MKKSSSVPSVAGVLDGGGCRKHIDERFASSLVGTQRRRSRKPYEQNWVPTTASCRMKQQGTLQQVCSRKCASSTSCRIHEASAFSLQQTLSHVRCFACQPATRAQDFDFRAHGKRRIDLPIQRCAFRYLFPPILNFEPAGCKGHAGAVRQPKWHQDQPTAARLKDHNLFSGELLQIPPWGARRRS